MEEVDRVHFGLVYVFWTSGSIEPAESSIITGKKIPIKEMMKRLREKGEEYETWSALLIPHLEEIYEKLRNKKNRFIKPLDEC